MAVRSQKSPFRLIAETQVISIGYNFALFEELSDCQRDMKVCIVHRRIQSQTFESARDFLNSIIGEKFATLYATGQMHQRDSRKIIRDDTFAGV